MYHHFVLVQPVRCALSNEMIKNVRLGVTFTVLTDIPLISLISFDHGAVEGHG